MHIAGVTPLDLAAMGKQNGGRVAAIRKERPIDDDGVKAQSRQRDQTSLISPVVDVAGEIPDNVHLLRAAFTADAVRAASELDVLDHAAAQDSDQLRRDPIAPTRAGEPLRSASGGVAPPVGHALPLRRTADSVPVVLGSVLGMLILVVFIAAAAFMKFAR